MRKYYLIYGFSSLESEYYFLSLLCFDSMTIIVTLVMFYLFET